MKALRITLFILSFLILATQSIRHVYVRWIEPPASVLDKFDGDAKAQIKKAQSLADLERQYAEAREKVKAAGPRPSDGDYDEFGTSKKEPYRTEGQLRRAIKEWEEQSKEILEVRYFWFCGFALLLVGALLHRRGALWPALAFVIAALGEMIWWTSPSFRGADTREFTRLLDNKLLFSVLSLLVLALCWYQGLLGPARGAAAPKDSPAPQS